MIDEISAAPNTPPIAPPTAAERSGGHVRIPVEFVLDVVLLAAQLSEEPFVTAGDSVKLKVVLIAVVEPGSNRLPMCEVDIMVALLSQQFVLSDADRQQNLPSEHCNTLYEYWLPTVRLCQDL